MALKQLLGSGDYSWQGVEPESLASWYLRVISNQFTVVTVQDVLNLVMTQGLGAKDAGFLRDRWQPRSGGELPLKAQSGR